VFVEHLRVLQLYPKEDYFTGAAIQLRELACGLHRRGHEVLIATRPSDIWTAKCQEAGLRHFAVPMASELDLRSVWQLIRILRRHRIQIVHAHKGKARTLAMIAGLAVKIPVLILNRGVSFPLDPFNRLGYTSGRVTAIVAVCHSIKQGLVRHGVDPGKIEVIYSGTDTDRFHPDVDGSSIRRELGLGPEHVLVTQIGLRSWKGNDDMLAAMAGISRRLPQARLLFVGANEAKSTIVHAKATALGLGDAVIVLPFREDVPEILAASDITVDASYAGLGLTGTLRESLAVGTPVVATDIEGNAELVVHGESGYLVRPRDPEALAEAVLTFASDRVRAAAMGRSGRARVERLFSMARKIERTEKLYGRLLAAVDGDGTAG
jgi:glycosyltransferase involved in cell wall biosynthesis